MLIFYIYFEERGTQQNISDNTIAALGSLSGKRRLILRCQPSSLYRCPFRSFHLGTFPLCDQAMGARAATPTMLKQSNLLPQCNSRLNLWSTYSKLLVSDFFYKLSTFYRYFFSRQFVEESGVSIDVVLIDIVSKFWRVEENDSSAWHIRPFDLATHRVNFFVRKKKMFGVWFGQNSRFECF